ncbi:MAG TPA: hypothetical protein G4N92_05430 [Anaerolineae bacterium]|nr:hypothetical protein [Anaerolineae bacterium]
MNDFISIKQRLFPNNYELIDGTNEVFELNIALWEFENLSELELIKRSGFFKQINGIDTAHYRLCNLQRIDEIYKNSTFRTRLFFTNGKYSTGYATHNLFPYRGKFHPQMIKGLLNIIDIKENEIVLDPMAGSGTLMVEANLLNINAIGVDLSPFCQLMSRVKTHSLSININRLDNLYKKQFEIFNILNQKKIPHNYLNEINIEDYIYYEIFLLAYLDAMGFARRSKKNIDNLYPIVIERYYRTIRNFNLARNDLELNIGTSKVLLGNALNLDIPDNSVDGVITSPPYSFAIDYIDNDQPQLEYLNYDISSLKIDMIGLRGKGINEKLKLYFNDVQESIKEMARVTKKDRRIVIIIGSNTIQTRGVELQPEIIRIAKIENLTLEMEIKKPIKGLRSSMKEESILIFKNNKE